jgi:cytochrome c556
MTAVACLVLGALVMPLMAEDTESTAPARPQLTEEQRAQVKALLEKFHADMKSLRAEVRTAMEMVRELRKSGAGEDEIKAALEAVKTKVQAVKARIEQLKTDLKGVVPPEVYERIMKRIQAKREAFLEDHPRIKERVHNRRTKRDAE